VFSVAHETISIVISTSSTRDTEKVMVLSCKVTIFEVVKFVMRFIMTLLSFIFIFLFNMSLKNGRPQDFWCHINSYLLLTVE
jgi:hypothetical protein